MSGRPDPGLESRLPVWEELERPGPDAVEVQGVKVRRGSRVLLRPRGSGDVLDLALAGKSAVVEGIDADLDGNLHVAVTVDDDPGRDLGEKRQPGHRFFFSLDEVEPLGAGPAGVPARRILVAGIGNVFLGDDGFGVEVADRLQRCELPAGVDVADFGIRGMDLAYALAGYDIAIFVDATPRGDAPGTVSLIEAEMPEPGSGPEAHGMDPVRVLSLARSLGEVPERVLVVGCEPKTRMTGEEEDVVVALSEPVRGAIEEAVKMVESLTRELAADDAGEEGTT